MTAAAQSDWPTQLSIASGSASALRYFGVREALRFRVVCSVCKSALEVDGLWRGVLLLAAAGRRCGSDFSPQRRPPSMGEWVAAQEWLMQFCLRDLSTFQVRLELEGVADGLTEEYSTHDGLLLRPVQISKLGAVLALQAGLGDPWDTEPGDIDWSQPHEVPTDFQAQLVGSTLLRVVLQTRLGRVVLVEAERDEDAGDDWLTALPRVGSRLTWHNETLHDCCEFAIHILSNVPSAAFAQVLLPGAELFPGGIGPELFPGGLGGDTLRMLGTTIAPPLTEEGLVAYPLHLVGEFWYSQGAAQYADHFESGGRDDWEPGHYARLASTFSAELLEPGTKCTTLAQIPEVRLCARGPELTDHLEALLGLTAFVRKDVLALDMEDVPAYSEKPDRLTLWLLDAEGRTRFHLHGLELFWVDAANRLVPAMLAHQRPLLAFAQHLPMNVCCIDFNLGRISLVFMSPEM